MHTVGFTSVHHLRHLWEQHEPAPEGPVDLHRKIRKQRHCQWFLIIIQVMSSGEKQHLVLWCTYSGDQVRIRVCLHDLWRPQRKERVSVIPAVVCFQVPFKQPGCEAGHISYLQLGCYIWCCICCWGWWASSAWGAQEHSDLQWAGISWWCEGLAGAKPLAQSRGSPHGRKQLVLGSPARRDGGCREMGQGVHRGRAAALVKLKAVSVSWKCFLYWKYLGLVWGNCENCNIGMERPHLKRPHSPHQPEAAPSSGDVAAHGAEEGEQSPSVHSHCLHRFAGSPGFTGCFSYLSKGSDSQQPTSLRCHQGRRTHAVAAQLAVDASPHFFTVWGTLQHGLNTLPLHQHYVLLSSNMGQQLPNACNAACSQHIHSLPLSRPWGAWPGPSAPAAVQDALF